MLASNRECIANAAKGLERCGQSRLTESQAGLKWETRAKADGQLTQKVTTPYEYE